MNKRLTLLLAAVLTAATVLLARSRTAVEGPEGPLPPARHEPRDIGFRPIVAAAVLTLIALVGIIALAAWLFPQSLRDKAVPSANGTFPAPQLQPSPPADMLAFRAQQLRQLDGTYWLDQAKTRLHIPIAQAMQDVARDGIKDWPAR